MDDGESNEVSFNISHRIRFGTFNLRNVTGI